MKDNIFIISQISDDISVICFVGYGDNDLLVSYFFPNETCFQLAKSELCLN